MQKFCLLTGELILVFESFFDELLKKNLWIIKIKNILSKRSQYSDSYLS